MRLEEILCQEYGVGICHAPTCAVQWAADKLLAHLPKDQVRRQVSELNAIRERHGYPLAYINIQAGVMPVNRYRSGAQTARLMV